MEDDSWSTAALRDVNSLADSSLYFRLLIWPLLSTTRVTSLHGRALGGGFDISDLRITRAGSNFARSSCWVRAWAGGKTPNTTKEQRTA
jgi:hypothetical protein